MIFFSTCSEIFLASGAQECSHLLRLASLAPVLDVADAKQGSAKEPSDAQSKE